MAEPAGEWAKWFTEADVEEFADSLWRIEGNYHREGSGPGSRFEGQRLEVVQVRYVLSHLAAAGRLLPVGTPDPDEHDRFIGELLADTAVRAGYRRAVEQRALREHAECVGKFKLCLKQNHPIGTACDRMAGHPGRHSWDARDG